MLLNLKTEMERNNVSVDDIAKLLNIHRNSASNKINCKTPITFDEAETIRNVLFPYADLQYLFKKVNTKKANKVNDD